MKVKLLLLFFAVLWNICLGDKAEYDKCTEGTSLSSQMRAFDSDIAYNYNLNEYMLVLYTETGQFMFIWT